MYHPVVQLCLYCFSGMFPVSLFTRCLSLHGAFLQLCRFCYTPVVTVKITLQCWILWFSCQPQMGYMLCLTRYCCHVSFPIIAAQFCRGLLPVPISNLYIYIYISLWSHGNVCRWRCKIWRDNSESHVLWKLAVCHLSNSFSRAHARWACRIFYSIFFRCHIDRRTFTQLFLWGSLQLCNIFRPASHLSASAIRYMFVNQWLMFGRMCLDSWCQFIRLQYPTQVWSTRFADSCSTTAPKTTDRPRHSQAGSAVEWGRDRGGAHWRSEFGTCDHNTS